MISVPMVSVVLPVYNGEEYLNEAINSILCQDFEDYECILINDGSTDSSSRIIDEYVEKDRRFRAIHQQNSGLIYSLNLGLKESQAKLVARMDADDICAPDRFQKQVDYMIKNPDVGLLGGGITLIDQDGQIIRDSYYPENGIALDQFISRGSPVAHPAVMMRKEIVLELGGYRAAYDACEDYDLWLRLHEVSKIDNLQDIVLFYRQHENKVSFKKAHKQAIGTVIARLAAKARKEGLMDPTDGLNSIDENIVGLFQLSPDESARVKLEILEVSANSLSLVRGSDALDQAVRDLSALSRKHNDIRARILLRAARGYMRDKKILKSAVCFLQSFKENPKEIFNILLMQGKVFAHRLLRR